MYSVIYTWPDGRREIRYTRPSTDRRLLDEVRQLQSRLGDECPYSIEYPGPLAMQKPTPVIECHECDTVLLEPIIVGGMKLCRECATLALHGE